MSTPSQPLLFDVHSDAYPAATRPHNASTVQRPLRVAAISKASDLPEALAEVKVLSPPGPEGWDVVVQATGHGAGAEVGDGTVLFDTSRLTDVSIDPERRTAAVGAGATWSAVNAAAERHGLLGLAGSSPTVGVSGYTFGGGIGWLVRRDGLASGSLRRVHYVDGSGRLRTAADDAAEQLDRDAIWAFRGAGGVGIAHTLEFDLVPAPDLHAGALLWHASALPELVAAWASVIDHLDPGVSSSISVLHVPPAPPFPEELRGSVAVHLAIADPNGASAAAPLLDAMRAAARPVADDWGSKDAAGLALIHLDPPDPVPAIGDARWLDATAPEIAHALLATAAAVDSPLVMMELRHVAGAPTHRDGAVVTPPGVFVYHSVGALGRTSREQIDDGFARARAVWSAADAGMTLGSWIEGAASVPAALLDKTRERARAIADAVDPDRLLRRSRLLA